MACRRGGLNGLRTPKSSLRLAGNYKAATVSRETLLRKLSPDIGAGDPATTGNKLLATVPVELLRDALNSDESLDGSFLSVSLFRCWKWTISDAGPGVGNGEGNEIAPDASDVASALKKSGNEM